MSKKKFIMTFGLSGSGKSFWAEQYKADNPNTTIITKDDIRASMGVIVNDRSTRVKESKVVEKRNELVLKALEQGRNIVVADTNLNPVHEKNLKSLVFPKYRDSYDFIIQDFTDVPIETCIERCAKRPEGRDFWKGVILKQKAEFLPAKKLYTVAGYYEGDIQKCVIFDLDGTLALMNGRGPYDEHRCFEDLPNIPVVEIAKMYAARPDVEVICLSGRKEDIARTHTENWLKANGINYDHLYMRKENDSRRDSIIKKEIFDDYIRDKYLVHAVFDDRPQVVREFWVEEGLPVFAFGNPFHEF